jgi:sialate O-acetylesterase
MNLKKQFQRAIALSIVAISAQTLDADVSLNALFSDGMIIQRETQAPIWGWADPGESVTVNASWGQSGKATTASDGTWSLKLQTPEAGGPHSIQVTGNNSLEIKDVQAGEVWFCSGQSNMDFPMDWIAGKARDPYDQPVADYIQNEIKTANDPQLRHIEVPNTASPFEKKTNFSGQWRSVSPLNSGKMTATGYFFARELRAKLNVPVGLIECAWGGTRVQPWISEEAYQKSADMDTYYKQEMAHLKKQVEQWDPEVVKAHHQAALEKWQANGQQGGKPRPQAHPTANAQRPSTLHKGMVSAVQPYAIKGTIWYQGESNANYMTSEYERYFNTLVTSWREEWGQGDFPFYWVQLASFKAPNDQPLDVDNWASICDQQRRSLSLPNTGMAVINDIGEAKDIHPRNKVDVGKRLAAWALVKDYGIDLPAYSGPLYRDHRIVGNAVHVRFNQVGSGLMVGHKHLMDAAVEIDEPLQRFQIAGPDRKWKWAEATISGNDRVIVTHPDISNPAAVRYAWSANPKGANLYNKEGFPASIFTTE